MRRGWRTIFAVVVLWGLLAAQIAYCSPGHHHTGSGHNCALCHFRNVRPLEAAGAVHLPQPVMIEWALAPASVPVAGEPPAIARSSRSPPV
jgi:hypothetical protein